MISNLTKFFMCLSALNGAAAALSILPRGHVQRADSYRATKKPKTLRARAKSRAAQKSRTAQRMAAKGKR